MTSNKEDSSATVRVSHRFSASPERVFNAWLDPATASRWLFATPSGLNVRAEIDARVGGRFTIVDRREGEDIEHTGEYLEIDRPRRLVFSFAVPKYSQQFTRVCIDIVPVDGGGCELTLTHEGVLQDYLARTRDGWQTMLQGLDAILRGARPG
ncbi:MAG TPA: SRPBCC family protein [Candidatus Limnocylindrales bacterium]|nr:SRPBCC family protein [Candidatus Limnocylindrales bacterium]